MHDCGGTGRSLRAFTGPRSRISNQLCETRPRTNTRSLTTLNRNVYFCRRGQFTRPVDLLPLFQLGPLHVCRVPQHERVCHIFELQRGRHGQMERGLQA